MKQYRCGKQSDIKDQYNEELMDKPRREYLWNANQLSRRIRFGRTNDVSKKSFCAIKWNIVVWVPKGDVFKNGAYRCTMAMMDVGICVTGSPKR